MRKAGMNDQDSLQTCGKLSMTEKSGLEGEVTPQGKATARSPARRQTGVSQWYGVHTKKVFYMVSIAVIQVVIPKSSFNPSPQP